MTGPHSHTELANTPQNAAGHVSTGRPACELRPVTRKAITPESFREELTAMRQGYSRNARRVKGEWGVVHYMLELWPRDPERLGGDPVLISSGSIPAEARRAEWLAQFSFSYDPARYAIPAPERLRGVARLRAFLQSFRHEQCAPVVMRPFFPAPGMRMTAPGEIEDENDQPV